MRRREFITLLGGAASWSLYARAQQPERVRRIGVLIGTAENDAEAQARLAVFRSSLERLGWRAGMAIMFNPDTVGSGAGLPFWNSFETAARTLGIEPVYAIVHSTSEIEKAIAMLGREPGNGLVVAPDSFTFIHRGAIISSTREVNLPAIYYGRLMAAEGGLISYGVDSVDLYRRAGPYVHRILNGENPSELPVQLPTKFELVINLKTAKTLGLTVPPSLLATADEVIE